MAITGEGKIVRLPNEAEDGGVVSARYHRVNGGRNSWAIEITGRMTIEVGPFGHHGFSIQFATLEPGNLYDGAFAANIARSLAPVTGQVKNQRTATPERMLPAINETNFADETVMTALNTILHIDGICTRVRIDVTEFSAGAGGKLVCYVM